MAEDSAELGQYWESVTATRQEYARRIGAAAAYHRRRMGLSPQEVADRANQVDGRLYAPRSVLVGDVIDFEQGEVWDDPFNPMDRPVWVAELIIAALETTEELLIRGTDWSPDTGRLQRAHQLRRSLLRSHEFQRRQTRELLRIMESLAERPDMGEIHDPHTAADD